MVLDRIGSFIEYSIVDLLILYIESNPVLMLLSLNGKQYELESLGIPKESDNLIIR